jgi:hypothetical protein
VQYIKQLDGAIASGWNSNPKAEVHAVAASLFDV